MTIGIIVAMDKEKELVVGHLQNCTTFTAQKLQFYEGEIGEHHIVLLRSGIGKVAAAVGATELIRRFQPDFVINTGVAGALNSKIGVADVVVATKTVYHDVDCFTDNPHGCIQGFPLYFECSETLLSALDTLDLSLPIHKGLICSGDQFVSKLDDLHTIKSYFPEGLAVDMESCAIAQVCYMFDVPFLSLRVISDTPGVNDHQGQYEDFWTKAPELSFVVLEKLLKTI